MLTGNGAINHDIETHTRDAQKTSAVRQESTIRNLHGSITKNFQAPPLFVGAPYKQRESQRTRAFHLPGGGDMVVYIMT